MWKRISATALVASFLFAILVNTAHAGVTQVPWGGLGAENLPCSSGAHWILTPGFGITAATVGVGTHDWTMVHAWDEQESWYIDTGPVAAASEVALAYLGAGDDRNELILANCVGQEPAPAPSPSPSTTPPPPGQPTPPSPSPSPSPAPSIQKHQAIILCPGAWTKPRARHVRLVWFSRKGVSLYRCSR